MTRPSYSGREICEWNIDGLSEYQIFTVCVNMMTFATSFRIRTSSDDQLIAKAIVYGFSGYLYSWWSHLPELEKDGIMNSTKIEQEEGSSMTTQESNAMTTLIYSIIKHFIGDPDMYLKRLSEQLANLTCPTLQDF